MSKPPASPSQPVTARRKGGRPPVDPNETPSDRFRRLAGSRVAATLDALRLLRQCFVTGSYEWTPDQADKAIKAIEAEGALLVKAARNPSGPSARKRGAFDL